MQQSLRAIEEVIHENMASHDDESVVMELAFQQIRGGVEPSSATYP